MTRGIRRQMLKNTRRGDREAQFKQFNALMKALQRASEQLAQANAKADAVSAILAWELGEEQEDGSRLLKFREEWEEIIKRGQATVVEEGEDEGAIVVRLVDVEEDEDEQFEDSEDRKRENAEPAEPVGDTVDRSGRIIVPGEE